MRFPSAELTSHSGGSVDPSRSEKAIVYFFPKAFTSGCTKEALRFNELYDKFREAGFEVYGVSTDSPETLRKFAERYGLRFALLSDRGGSLAGSLGILRKSGSAERVTYVLVRGEIAAELRNLRSPSEHADRALEEALKLGAA